MRQVEDKGEEEEEEEEGKEMEKKNLTEHLAAQDSHEEAVLDTWE